MPESIQATGPIAPFEGELTPEALSSIAAELDQWMIPSGSTLSNFRHHVMRALEYHPEATFRFSFTVKD